MKRVGQNIDDYRLTRLLGAGTFGEVYLGEHLRDRSLAAVKLLTISQVDLKAFIKEASATFRLQHPHIVHLRAFGISADESPYLVMDYAPNGTLLQRHPTGTRLPLDTIVSYLLPLAAALQYAHDNRVIHRDVKPANVLIGPGGQTSVPPAGKIIFQDPLNKDNPSIVWIHPEDRSSPCGRFASDGYHIISTGSLKACQESTYQFQDVIVSVDISIAQGDSGGVYCRFATDFLHIYYGYLFEVNSSGQYKISLDSGGTALQPWTDSPFINKGLNVKNTLLVTVKYNTLSLYINGHYIITVIHKPPDYQATATADGATATAEYSNGPPNPATATAISTTLTYDQGKIPAANATPPLLKPEQGIALVASTSTSQETEVVFSNLVISVP